MLGTGVRKACTRRSLLSFGRERDGTIAALIALLLAVLLGVVALSFDLGRTYNLHTELQSAVDAAALAAGGQLDTEANARNRACLAAVGVAFDPTAGANGACGNPMNTGSALVTNAQTFATDGAGANVVSFTVTFWQSLTKDLSGNLNNPATSDGTAEFVEVRATPRNINFWFAGVVSAIATVPVTARAVAGMGAAFCQVPPMFVCQPGGNPFTTADIGKGVWLKGKQGADMNTAWLDGNFGLLALPGHTLSAAEIRDALGRVNPLAACYAADDTVETKPGQTTTIGDYLNLRFDIYTANDVAQNDPNYQPAENTVKGLWGPGNCKLANNSNGWYDPDIADRWTGPADADLPPADLMGFPRDNCAYTFAEGGDETCRAADTNGAAGRYGNGVWDWVDYFAVNHPAYATDPNADPDIDLDGNGHATRWEVYQWELDGHLSTNPNENADPTCYTGPALPTSDPTVPNDRRLLCVAAVDCTGLPGGQQPLEPEQWVALFLTEPVGVKVGLSNTADNKSIYAEVVGPEACAGDDSIVARYIVQLYE